MAMLCENINRGQRPTKSHGVFIRFPHVPSDSPTPRTMKRWRWMWRGAMTVARRTAQETSHLLSYIPTPTGRHLHMTSAKFPFIFLHWVLIYSKEILEPPLFHLHPLQSTSYVLSPRHILQCLPASVSKSQRGIDYIKGTCAAIYVI